MARKPPTLRAGNYVAPVDTEGVDQSMIDSMSGTKMNKLESNYVSGAKNKVTATEAVRRARKANKQPRLRAEE